MKRLTRSMDDKIVAGVCSGMAKYFEIDPLIVRLIWVAGILLSLGTGIVTYLLFWWLLVPEDT